MRRVLSFSLSIIVLIIIILTTTVLADTGCFLESESDEYCQQINYEDAEFECSLYEECNINTAFLESKQCSLFEECEEILCQSSCETELAGLCSSGPVPEGEEDLWCQNEGCCQYWPEGVEPSCQVEENKWVCHIVASNAGATSLNWDQSIDQTTCEEVCLADTYPYTAELSDYDLSYYTEANSESDEVETTILASSSSDSEDSSEAAGPKTEILSGLIDLLAPFFLIIIAILILIFFYEHRHTIIKDYHKVKDLASKTSKPKSQEFESQNSMKSSDSFIITLGKHHHKHKHHKQHAKLELAESFGSYHSAKIPTNSGLQRLQHLVNRHNRKSARRKRSRDKLAQKLPK
tara:strand:+ start:1632 stop:2678 length:1047 start_codon:yes stop_codon:yes gene_type:complete